jgi:phosphinothricin acetyltransferase
MSTARVRPATAADCEAIARIYNHYIRDTIITFEEVEVSAQEIERRLGEVASASLPWLVVENTGAIAGYAYATKWHGRCAYRYSAESTVYLEAGQTGRGYGTRLYTELMGDLRARSIHAVMGGIALPNAASIALHEKLGFSKVAHFREVGFKFGQWIDVGYWQASP